MSSYLIFLCCLFCLLLNLFSYQKKKRELQEEKEEISKREDEITKREEEILKEKKNSEEV